MLVSAVKLLGMSQQTSKKDFSESGCELFMPILGFNDLLVDMLYPNSLPSRSCIIHTDKWLFSLHDAYIVDF